MVIYTTRKTPKVFNFHNPVQTQCSLGIMQYPTTQPRSGLNSYGVLCGGDFHTPSYTAFARGYPYLAPHGATVCNFRESYQVIF